MGLIQADARAIPLQDGCVQCVVTSPPYWGLRDYGTTGQIGMEASPDAYVDSLRAVFQGLARVLSADGTVWLNLGDTYAGNRSYQVPDSKWRDVGNARAMTVSRRRDDALIPRSDALVAGCKAKDMVGIPWRVAFALQADGWYLRSDVIWSKPNPMPESVTDRPTKAHEYLFLLSKSSSYYYDSAAIAEPVSAAMLTEMEQGYDGLGLKDYEAAGVQNPSSVKARIIENARRKNEQTGDRRKVGFNDRWDASEKARKGDLSPRRDGNDWNSNNGRGFPCDGVTRNKRTVWTIPTMPYSGAHFATMPEKLVEPCILAGSRPGDRILDPFSGSGTVGAVAERLGRRWVGVDLNPAYHQLAKRRTAQRGIRW